MKAANFAPWYAALYPQFAEIARKHGYALAVHGSMARDFDVVAIPWREQVSTPRQLLDDVLTQFAVEEIGEPTLKEHGRVAYTISIGFGDCFADWSFMPALATTNAGQVASSNTEPAGGWQQEQVEAVARAIHASDNNPLLPYDEAGDLGEQWRELHRVQARAALAALSQPSGEQQVASPQESGK